MKKISKAVQLYKQAFKFYPSNIDIALKLGSLYAYSQNYKKASKYFNFVVSMQPYHYEANFILAKLNRDKFLNYPIAL